MQTVYRGKAALRTHSYAAGRESACLRDVQNWTGEWRKLHDEELHDLYSSPSIIKIMKARRMR
jgi:hypothetical protein